jgi:hypothetical protein
MLNVGERSVATEEAQMPPRWTAIITYRTEAGPLAVEHDIEELAELHRIVEWGPDWNTIIDIKVVLALVTQPDLTIA